MSREAHVRFCESVGVRFPHATRHEFGFATYSEAEQDLANLQGELSAYELHLNPRKTRLFDLTGAIEHPWATELRGFRIRGKGPVSRLV